MYNSHCALHEPDSVCVRAKGVTREMSSVYFGAPSADPPAPQTHLEVLQQRATALKRTLCLQDEHIEALTEQVHAATSTRALTYQELQETELEERRERARAARTAWLKEKAEEDAAVDEFKRRRRAALGLSADMARVSLNSSGSGAGTVFGAMEA